MDMITHQIEHADHSVELRTYDDESSRRLYRDHPLENVVEFGGRMEVTPMVLIEGNELYSVPNPEQFGVEFRR